MDGGNGSLKTDKIIMTGGGDVENGEIRRENYFALPQEGAHMVALGKQGLNNWGELECRLFLVAGRSGIVGFIERRVGSRWSGGRPGDRRV